MKKLSNCRVTPSTREINFFKKHKEMQNISGEDSSGDEEIVKLERDPLYQSDHKGQNSSEGPRPEGEGEQAGQEHGAAPAYRLAPAPNNE